MFDADQAGANQRQIAIAFWGKDHTDRNWGGKDGKKPATKSGEEDLPKSDCARSWVQRLVREGRRMVNGGYRDLLE